MTVEIVCGFREYTENPALRCVRTTSEETTLKIATEQGLSAPQTKIYSTLSKKGPSTFESISKILKIDETEICRAILRLQKLGLVYVGDV